MAAVVEEATQESSSYSALWQCPPGEGTREYVEAQLSSWLRERDVDIDLSTSQVTRLGGKGVFVANHERAGAPEFHTRLLERNERGTWRTELTLRAPLDFPGWLRLRVTNDRGIYVPPPRLARYLLESGQFLDGGSLQITSTPTPVRAGMAEDVAEVITDTSREGLVFVAGTDARLPFDPFVQQVGRWSKDVVGLAEVYVLDPLATRALIDILGAAHGVRPWTLRTYLPGVDPALEGNDRNHRWISTEKLVTSSDGYIRKTLGLIARAHADTRPIPDHVRQSIRAFARIENHLVADKVGGAAELRSRLTRIRTIEEPPQTPADESVKIKPAETAESTAAAEEVARHVKTLELVRRVLNVPEITEDALRSFIDRITAEQQEARENIESRLSEQEAEIDRLTDQLQTRRIREEELELDAAIAMEESARLADVEKWLRRQFRDTQQAWLVSTPIPESERTPTPDSFAQLVEWLTKDRFARVSFTGDSSTTSLLDLQSGLDVALRSAHAAVLALRDYARVKSEGAQGSVDYYLRNTPNGCRSVPLKRHAATESETVLQNRRLASMRVFPVPRTVHSSRSRLMSAHFKLGLAGMVSPRLYYLDDTSGTGKVYIGYIGEHLENTKTN